MPKPTSTLSTDTLHIIIAGIFGVIAFSAIFGLAIAHRDIPEALTLGAGAIIVYITGSVVQNGITRNDVIENTRQTRIAAQSNYEQLEQLTQLGSGLIERAETNAAGIAELRRRLADIEKKQDVAATTATRRNKGR